MRKRTTFKQPELEDVHKPKEVTVNGDGLEYWAARAKAGELQITHMEWDRKRNAIMHLKLFWIDGRPMYSLPPPASRLTPLRGANQIDKAQQLSLEAFK